MFKQYFNDVTYSCLIVIRQHEQRPQIYTNQANVEVRQFGVTKIRAIELLK